MTTFDPTQGPRRVDLTGVPREDMDALERQALVAVDGRRARSHYFDGRFLAARDLEREQSYLLTRQADLALARGAGVVRGPFRTTPRTESPRLGLSHRRRAGSEQRRETDEDSHQGGNDDGHREHLHGGGGRASDHRGAVALL